MDIGEQIKIRKRVDAATKGPWVVESTDDTDTDIALGYDLPGMGTPLLVATCFGQDEDDDPISLRQAQKNAVFISHAREDVDRLLDEVGRLRAKLGLLRQFALDESSKWEGRNADRMYEANRFLHQIDSGTAT